MRRNQLGENGKMPEPAPLAKTMEIVLHNP